jgi:hypothetical protein
MPRHELTPEERSRGGKNGKRLPIDEALKQRASEIVVTAKDKSGKETKMTMQEAIDLALLEGAAVSKDIRFIKEYYDRTEGKAKQTIETVTPDKSPFDLDEEEEDFLKENYDDPDKKKKTTSKGKRTTRKKTSSSTVAGKKTSRNA